MLGEKRRWEEAGGGGREERWEFVKGGSSDRKWGGGNFEGASRGWERVKEFADRGVVGVGLKDKE